MTGDKRLGGVLVLALLTAIPLPGCSPPDKPPKPRIAAAEITIRAIEPAKRKSTSPGLHSTIQGSRKEMLGSPELTAGIPGKGPLKLDEIEPWLADPKNHERIEVEPRLGLSAGVSQIQGMDKNPLTRAKIELGRQLYFDPHLSADRSVSCATCHDPDQGYAAHAQFGVGIAISLAPATRRSVTTAS